MAAKRKASTPKKATPKSFYVNIQLPGQPASKKQVKSGTTLGDIVDNMNLDGYEVRLNGTQKTTGTKLVKGDVIRVGIKTKQGS